MPNTETHTENLETQQPISGYSSTSAITKTELPQPKKIANKTAPPSTSKKVVAKNAPEIKIDVMLRKLHASKGVTIAQLRERGPAGKHIQSTDFYPER
jgi:hypothetical protein